MISYFFLFAAISAALWRLAPGVIGVLTCLSVVSAVFLGVIAPAGLLSVGLGAVLAILPVWRPDSRTLLIGAALGAGLLALASVFRLLPGFPSLVLMEQFGRPGEGVLAWRYDKGFAGLVLVWLHQRYLAPSIPASVLPRMIILFAGTFILLALAIPAGLGRWEPALVTGWWLWIIGNLYLTVVAEEALFRGLIQQGLHRLLPGHSSLAFSASVGLAAVVFASAHLPWGVEFAFLAGGAGVVYGLLYGRARTLIWAIAGHATVNIGILLLLASPFG